MKLKLILSSYRRSKSSEQDDISAYKKAGIPIVGEDDEDIIFGSKDVEFSTIEELVELSKLVGEIIITDGQLEIYNDYRE